MPDPDIRIRNLEPEDLDPVFLVESLSFPSPWSRATIEAEWQAPQATCLVARHTNTVVGYLCYRLVAGEFDLTRIAVHPDHRKGRIGEFLVRHALDEARNRGANVGFLEVAATNQPAIALYERTGFTRQGVRPNYYGTGKDALILSVPFP